MNFEEIRHKYFLDSGNQDLCALWLHRALEASFHFLQNPEHLKIHSDVTLPDLEKIFHECEAPQIGEGLEATFQQAVHVVLRHSVRVANPYYIGHMTQSVPYFGLIVDLLTSALNQNVVKIETALSASFVEGQTLVWLHKIVFGRSESFYRKVIHNPDVCLGNVTSGGTLGNLTALTVARNLKLPNSSTKGLAQALVESGYSRVVILTSKRVHYSIKKAAGVLGLGGDNVLEIPVGNFSNSIDINELENQIATLKSEKALILALVGVAGSTETGSIDDLPTLARMAQAHDIWFHVDAAWGGAILLSDKYKQILDGIQLADSVILDGHKLFYLPLSNGAVLFKNEKHLDSLRHTARYIIRQGSVDLGRTSLEGSRRFDSFKMWFFLKVFGTTGYGKLIDHSLELTRKFETMVSLHNFFQATSQVQTNIFTYRYVPEEWKTKLTKLENIVDIPQIHITFANEFLNSLNVEIQKVQRQNGRSFVSRTTLESVFPGHETVVFRVLPFNPLTTPQILADILSEQKVLGIRLQRLHWRRFKKSSPHGFENFFALP